MRAIYQVIKKPLTDFHRFTNGVWTIESLPVGSYIYDADVKAPNRNSASFELMLDRGRIVDVSSQQIDVENGDYSKIGTVDLSNKAQQKADTKHVQSGNKKGGKKGDDVEEVEEAENIKQDLEEEVN